jgi:hypothetical protein
VVGSVVTHFPLGKPAHQEKHRECRIIAHVEGEFP